MPPRASSMAATSLNSWIALGLLSGLILSGSASEFLKAPKDVAQRVSEEYIQTTLLEEVEGTLGTGSATGRLSQLETILKPIVAALPKNENGYLGHAAVGYALHRLFVQRHGWVIKGLHSKGETQGSSSPTGILKEQVPAYIEGLFEKRLAGMGLGLHEVAVLAATIEHLIHNEAVSRLGAALDVHKLPVMRPVSATDASMVLDTYMISYILGEDLRNLTLASVQRIEKDMPSIFLAWGDTQKFVRDVQKTVTENAAEVDFGSLSRVVEAVSEQFGSFQDFECRDLKEKLVHMEYRGTGRVKLSDFYRPALDGAWTFQESSGYLRSTGLLDESDPKQPSVMIANYVTSPANCIVSSGFYSVCCKNECDGLLSHLETSIGASEAKPETIASLVANLPSGTGVALPKLSPTLRQRLADIASTHRGLVPLHGRLFAQWMHHLYPRECPYPHISGTAESLSPTEFLDDATASHEEMKLFIGQAGHANESNAEHDLSVEEMMPWSHEEELFVVRSQIAHGKKSPMSLCARSAVLLSAVGSLVFGLSRSLQTMSGGASEKIEKYTV